MICIRAMRRPRILPALLVAVLLVAACAGDDADGDGAPDETDDPAEEPTAATDDASETTVPGDGAGDRSPEDVAALNDEELAAEAYVAGYPMVVSIRTMQRLAGLVGTNTLFSQAALSGPESRIIVAPNRDTLYSIAILDLRGEPYALTLPEVTDRYFTYQLLSPWTESFAYLGTRATGGEAGTWVITPPGWEGDLPEGTQRIEAPTSQVFLLGRFLVDDEADVANVVDIGDHTTLEALSSLTGTAPAAEPPPLGEAVGAAQDIPADAAFFAELAPSLAANPPATPYQQAVFAAAEERLGLGTDAPDEEVLAAGAAAGAERIATEVADRAELHDGWAVNREIGRYGDDLALRAVVSRIGWGANVPEEAVYPIARVDGDGEPLDGTRTYTLTFPADALPPVDELGFWSLSVYGGDMFFAPHPSGRYTIGDRTPGLVRGDDGSLTITLSHAEPAAGTGAWLPVPEGPFVLMLRLYLPADAVLDGSWTPPPVVPT